MEPEVSSPRSQEPANSPYPESDQPSPISWSSILISSFHLLLDLPGGHLPSGFPTKTLYDISPAYVLRAPPISFLIWSVGLYAVRRTNHEAPRSAVSSVPRHLVPLRTKYRPQHPILLTPLMAFCYRACMYVLLEEAWVLVSGEGKGNFQAQASCFPRQLI